MLRSDCVEFLLQFGYLQQRHVVVHRCTRHRDRSVAFMGRRRRHDNHLIDQELPLSVMALRGLQGIAQIALLRGLEKLKLLQL